MIFKYPPTPSQTELWNQVLHSIEPVLRVVSGGMMDGTTVRVVGVDFCPIKNKNLFVCAAFSRKEGSAVRYGCVTLDQLKMLTNEQHQIEQMLTICATNDAAVMAKALYDAGYRKIMPQLLTLTQTPDQFDRPQPTIGETK